VAELFTDTEPNTFIYIDERPFSTVTAAHDFLTQRYAVEAEQLLWCKRDSFDVLEVDDALVHAVTRLPQ
jgi:hypothetical protein